MSSRRSENITPISESHQNLTQKNIKIYSKKLEASAVQCDEQTYENAAFQGITNYIAGFGTINIFTYFFSTR